MKSMGYLTIGLLSWIVACGGGTATAPAGDSAAPAGDLATDDSDDSDEVLGVIGGHPDDAYHLYMLPIPLAGAHEPALPAAWPHSLAIFDEATVLYEGEEYLEAAAAFLRAADTISDIDPYHADTFDKIRGLMCGNAHWAFMSADAAEQIEPAAAQRDESDPVCASTLRSGHNAPDEPAN